MSIYKEGDDVIIVKTSPYWYDESIKVGQTYRVLAVDMSAGNLILKRHGDGVLYKLDRLCEINYIKVLRAKPRGRKDYEQRKNPITTWRQIRIPQTERAIPL